jgi:hypothetical protein
MSAWENPEPDTLADEAAMYALAYDGEPGLSCGSCGALWNPLSLRRFGDQACPNCGDLYPGVNLEP